jgi:hypothetical protein
MWKKVKWALALAGIPVVLGYLGCGLDKVDVPEVAGPSEFSQSLEMHAIPDQLTADGWSSSVIEVVYRNENGQRTQGQSIRFDLGARGSVGAGGGTFSDFGNLAPLNGERPLPGGVEARALSAVTDSQGVARVRYWAPFRTDSENDNVVTITSRPTGTDFRAAIFRQVDIFLRAANRPAFPGVGVCGYQVEPQKVAYEVDEKIFFTATQLTGDTTTCTGQPIARYEWNFGDDLSDREEGRNVEHSYDRPGSYTVTLFTTETASGCQVSCSPVTIVVVP